MIIHCDDSHYDKPNTGEERENAINSEIDSDTATTSAKERGILQSSESNDRAKCRKINLQLVGMSNNGTINQTAEKKEMRKKKKQ